MIVPHNNDTNANQKKQSDQALKRRANGAQQSNTVSSGGQKRSSLHPEVSSFVSNTLSEPSCAESSRQAFKQQLISELHALIQ